SKLARRKTPPKMLNLDKVLVLGWKIWAMHKSLSSRVGSSFFAAQRQRAERLVRKTAIQDSI
ncbi:MAG: hypothetical protein ACREQW_21625, partial [Candidatus Binatia bacterium]